RTTEAAWNDEAIALPHQELHPVIERIFAVERDVKDHAGPPVRCRGRTPWDNCYLDPIPLILLQIGDQVAEVTADSSILDVRDTGTGSVNRQSDAFAANQCLDNVRVVRWKMSDPNLGSDRRALSRASTHQYR